jgi:hypothetical protein
MVSLITFCAWIDDMEAMMKLKLWRIGQKEMMTKGSSLQKEWQEMVIFVVGVVVVILVHSTIFKPPGSTNNNLKMFRCMVRSSKSQNLTDDTMDS